MLRTWVRADGSQYAPSEVPAFWRRWVDRTSWKQAEAAFGPLNWEISLNPSKPWRDMHRLLLGVARHWQPIKADEAVYQLVNPLPVLSSTEARLIRQAIEQAIKNEKLTLGLELGRVWPTPQTNTLDIFLLADCAHAIDTGAPYRRCAQCGEWFAPTRSDAVFCGSVCKQAAYVARHASDA